MGRGILMTLVVFLTAAVLSSCEGKGPGGTQPGQTPPADEKAYYIPHDLRGPAVDKLEFGAFHVDQAVPELESGNIDLYLFGLKVAAAKKLEANAKLGAFKSPSGQVSLLLNPAPAREGKLNPLSLPEVRRSINYLIDRQFIAQELYGGFAVPMTSHVSSLDYDYLTVHDILAEKRIGYDPAYAKTIIARAMTQAGAELTGGKWHYNGSLIRLKFIIRVEDERRDVGDTIRVALENAGFQVEPAYKTFAAAISTVYTSDPQAFEWHLYTEGWGRGAPEKYDFATINQMAASWMGNMPGWQIVGFWQYQNEKLDELGKKLFTGAFASQEERNDIYREMTRIAMEDAVRLWVATTVNTFPADKNVRGVTEDLVAGPRSLLALREAFIPGKNVLKVGNLWVWTERTTWNPIGGLSDVYSVDVWKNMYDPPLIQHPFSGIPIPFRVGFEIETAGPKGKLDVPAGVVIWDASGNRWREVAPGTMATSRVVFDYSKYFGSTWHNGQTITMADVIYGIYQNFELTYDPEKSKVEFVLAATQKPLLDTFKGFRVLDENRLEVWVDYWHFEESHIASYASPASLSMPWEILAAMDKLVFEDRTAAYSQAASARYSVPWISLVMGRDSSMTARALREFERNEFVPNAVFDLGGLTPLSATEAQERYRDSLAWFDQYGHLVISQGPFFLSRYDPPAQFAELSAFRDLGYPFSPGDWYMGKADVVNFENVSVSGTTRGEDIVVEASLKGSGNVSLEYLLVDPSSGKIIASGDAERTPAGTFRVELNGGLTAPLTTTRVLELRLLASSDSIALIQEKQVDIILR